jgi:hypothetical protein
MPVGCSLPIRFWMRLLVLQYLSACSSPPLTPADVSGTYCREDIPNHERLRLRPDGSFSYQYLYENKNKTRNGKWHLETASSGNLKISMEPGFYLPIFDQEFISILLPISGSGEDVRISLDPDNLVYFVRQGDSARTDLCLITSKK